MHVCMYLYICAHCARECAGISPQTLSLIFQTAVLLWMHDPAGRDAIVIRQALLPDTINLDAATEVICSRTPSQIQLIKQNYQAKFGVFLEQDIEKHTSGDHKKVHFLNTYLGMPSILGALFW